ncbi:mediator of RNA polymerase II transcription subunit 23-like isoform X2 [Anoplolepis gracilipes]|uniref:mediator of RNA polymerase II transcription subunit 23-like isoform X2 n=1 Tax=Anoplolepis gracilipes TaxID=354296 RepID=UPI003BA3231C
MEILKGELETNTQKMSTETQIANIINDILKVEAIEEAFSCVLVHQPGHENEKITTWQNDLNGVIGGLTKEEQETAVRQFLSMTAAMTNHKRLQLLLSLLQNLVQSNFLSARLVCKYILSDELQYQSEDFWVECFVLIRHIIDRVDYKEVREIMKRCKEKVQTMPAQLNESVQPQLKALENVVEYIFDRNAKKYL